MNIDDKGNKYLLHMTIGAAPSGAVSLEHDLRMAKAALLYADRTKLCSPTSSMILHMLVLGNIDTNQSLDVFEQLASVLLRDESKAASVRNNIYNYRILMRKKKLRLDEERFLARFDKMMQQSWIEIRRTIEQQAEEAGTEGLITALNSGYLELHPFDVTGQTTDIASQFVTVIGDAVSDGTTYPLFDDSTGDLVKAHIEEGRMTVSDSTAARAKHGGLVGSLLERLPLFDEASVSEILDIRRELDVPLVRFRGAIIGFADKIKTAAWDPDFSSDVEAVYRRDIEPTVLDIEETVKANRELSSLLPKLADKQLTIGGGSVLGLIISQLNELPEIVRTALGVGIPATILLNETVREWREKNRQVERNQLYFYYKAKAKLAH